MKVLKHENQDKFQENYALKSETVPTILDAVRSMKLAPVSLQMAFTNNFLPLPTGPDMSSDLIRGEFSCTTWEPPSI